MKKTNGKTNGKSKENHKRATVEQRGKIHSELSALNEAKQLTPARVVEAARNPKSAMHSHFDWDDASAAQKYREDQARTLIRSFEIEFRGGGTTIFHVQEFVEDPRKPEKEQGYISFSTIKSDKQLRREFMDRELMMAEVHVNRTRQFAGALKLLPEVEEIEESLADLRSKVIPQKPNGKPHATV